MFHKFFRWFSSLFFALAVSLSMYTPVRAATPANDNFADAEVITSLPFSAMVDVTDATTESGEFPCGIGPGRTVWYSFTPSQNIAARLDLAGSPTPGAVSVYLSSGSGISDLTFLTCVFSNNSVNMNFEAGNTYYLQVNASSSQFGIIQFNLEQIFPPANDNFADAEVITSLSFTATVDVTDATTESGEFPCGIGPGRTVWYSFTPTRNIAALLDLAGSPTPGAVSVYLSSGPGISDLTILTCVFSNNSANINFEAGNTYYLQVNASSSQFGIIQFKLEAPNDLLPVSIDVKPGSEANPINATSKGKIPVAILSTADFDAPSMVDTTSLTFGKTGDEPNLAFCSNESEDVNEDGLFDVVCHFYTQDTGFQIGDTEGILKGQTVDGIPIEGYDSVNILK